jgi:hypothetical protein
VYAPADVLLRSLDKFGEIDRLRRLRHTGALELVLPGIPHSRWDYVASMLFSAWRLDLESPTTTTKFGDTSFSSMRAIIQCAALLSSMGHLPGTFSTEKGLTQWLFKESSESPTSLLPWPEHLEPRERKQLIEQADEFLARTDYAGLNRILSLVRILGFLVQGSNDRNELLHNLVYDFYLPFLFPERRAPERVELWEKIEANYQTVRHISYLNLDAAFANVPVRVDVTGLLGGSLRLRHSESSDTERDHQSSVDRIEHAREVLGAYEHSVFEDLYHSERARKCTAVVAHLVREELQRSADPMKTLTDWLHRSDLEDIVNRRALRAAMDEFKTIVGISVRTHLLSVPPSQKILAEQEEEFTYSLSTVTSPNIKSLSNIVTYQPWEREQHLEPAHVYIDFFTSGRVRTNYIGRIIWEFARTFDKREIGPLPEADFYLLEKPDLGSVYSQLISTALSMSLGGRKATLKSWRTSTLKPALSEIDDVPVWAANRDLSDEHIRSLLRRGEWAGPRDLRSQWAELLGLAELRDRLRGEDRRKYGSSQPRQRHLILTSSVRMAEGNQIVAEFDGGIVRIRSRKGHMTFYGLETKSRNSSGKAVNVLERKLEKLGLATGVKVYPLGKRSAYCEVSLDEG